MAQRTEVLELLLTARYAGAPAFNSMARDISTLANSTSSLAKVGAVMNAVGMGMTAAGAAGLAVIGQAVTAASQFDQAMSRMTAVGAISAKQQDAVTASIMRTSEQYGQSSTDIAQAGYNIASMLAGQGYAIAGSHANLKAYLSTLNQMGAFVAASGNGLPGSVDWSTASQDIPHLAAAFSLAPSKWATLMGQMTIIENRSGLLQSQLITSALRAAPTAAELGVTPESLLATIGVLGSKGDYTARGGTELAASFRQLLTNRNAQSALAAMGLSPSSFYKNGQLEDPGLIYSSIYSHLEAVKNPRSRFALEQRLWGAVGNRAAGLLLSPSGMAMYESNLKAERRNPVAYMNNAAARMVDNFAGSVKRFHSAVHNLLVALGRSIEPLIKPWLDRLTSLMNRLSGFLLDSKNAGLVAKIGKGLLGGTAVGLTGGPLLMGVGHLLMSPGGQRFVEKGLPAMGHGVLAFGRKFSPLRLAGVGAGKAQDWLGGLDAGKVLPALAKGAGDAFGWLKNLPKASLGAVVGFFKSIGPALKVAVPAALSFGSALLPIIAVALLVAGAIAVGVLAFTRYRKQVMDVVHTFQSAFAPVFKFVRGVVLSVLRDIQHAWKAHAKEIDAAMKQLMAAMKASAPFFQEIGYVIGGVISIIIKVIGYLVEAFIAALPYIIGVFTGIFRVLGDLGNMVQAILHGKWGAAWSYAKAALSDAWGTIKSLLMMLWTFVSQVFVNLWKDISGPLKGLWNNVTQWFANLGKGVQSAFTGALSSLGSAIQNAVISAIQWALNHLPGGPITHAALNAMGLGRFAGHATGGYIPRTMLSWVGEKGPELLALPGGSRVYSHMDSIGMLNEPLRPGVSRSGQRLMAPLKLEVTGLNEALSEVAAAIKPQRQPAEELLFARQIQREREAVWERYSNTARAFDHTYRHAYQYYG